MDASTGPDADSVLPLPIALEYGVAGSGELPDRSVVFDNQAFDKEEKGSDSGLETVSKL